MKVLHTISGLSVGSGGPSQSVFHTVAGLRQQGTDAAILTYQTDRMVSKEAFITALPPTHPKLAYSRAFRLHVVGYDCDIYHAHALWQYPTHITSRIARKKNKPYIISPRGMLYPSALQYSKWVKKIFMELWFNKDLHHATCIHATCMQELEHIRNFGLRNPVAVIPNLIVVKETPVLQETKKQIGFVGRLHPIKNIEVLIDAFNKINAKDYQLVIVGDGEAGYVQSLKNRASNNNIFTGFLDGKQKEEAISGLSYLILPSFSENFGMVVPEALIKGIPVIASKGTPWEELNTHKCGWWVGNDIDTLAATIEAAINTPESKRLEMGQNGQKLVIENYSVEVVAKKMIRLYEWILNGGAKPEFVFM